MSEDDRAEEALMADEANETDAGVDTEEERKRDKREWIAIATCVGLLSICGVVWKTSVWAGLVCLGGAIAAGAIASASRAPSKRKIERALTLEKPVLFDENGLAHPCPLMPEVYEDRPLVWMRYLLFVVALGLVYFAIMFQERADDRDEEERVELVSEYYDRFSGDFEGQTLPAVDAVIAGDDGQISKMFIFRWPYAEQRQYHYGSVLDVVHEHEVWEQMVQVPEVSGIVHAEADWDRALTGMLASDGRSVTDMDALRAARDGDLLVRLRAMEEESLVALNQRHESLRRGRLLATIEGWASLLLILPVIAGAEWIRVATRREVERDNTIYRAALAEYERLEAIAQLSGADGAVALGGDLVEEAFGGVGGVSALHVEVGQHPVQPLGDPPVTGAQ